MNTNLTSRLSLLLVALSCLAPSKSLAAGPSPSSSLDPALAKFIAAKQAQVQSMEKDKQLKLPPEVSQFFAAVQTDNYPQATNLFDKIRRYSIPDLGNNTQSPAPDSPYPDLRKGPWQPLSEVIGAYQSFHSFGARLTKLYGDEVIKSIPPGAIYFGGTDWGRSIVSALSDSQIDGKPFFTLTQNALADDTYVDYLRLIYAKQIHLLSTDDLQAAFAAYTKDVQRRNQHDQDPALDHEPRQLKSGEIPVVGPGKRFTISGQVSVMSINALLVKDIFDANPDREFYLEESFPLDWTFPFITPNGPIVKINRKPVAELTADVVQTDQDYWRNLTGQLIGNWISNDTSVKVVCEFAEKTYVSKDLGGFKGDRDFAASLDARKAFSKLRLTIADLYAWRLGRLAGTSTPRDFLATSTEEKNRVTAEADFAYRQAFAMCPESSEVIFRYVQFLANQGRFRDASLVASTCLKCNPTDEAMASLVKQLEPMAAAGTH